MADAYTTQSYGYRDPGFSYSTEVKTQALKKPRNPAILLLVVIGIVLLVILVLLLLGIGGGSNNNGASTDDGDSSKAAVIQWWGMFLDNDVVEPLIDEYQKLNPNITIEYANKRPNGSFQNAEKSYRNALNDILRENDPVQIPDIFMVHNSWVGDYEKYVQPSTEYSFETFSSSFYEAVVDDFAHNNQVLGVPLWMDTFAILYNADLLEAQAISSPPSGWTEFKNASITLTQRDNSTITKAGFAAGNSENISFASQLLFILFAQNGVSFLNSQNQAVFATYEDSVGALTFFQSFANDNGTWSNDLNNDAVEFLQSDLAMMFAPSWRYRDILSIIEANSINLEVGVSQIPQLQAQSQPIINWADYWGNMVALNRPYSKQSWAFLEWVSQPEQLKKLSENTKNKYGYFGILYPRSDMSSELANDPYLRIYNESLPYAKTWYQVKGIEIRDVFNELISKNPTLSNVAKAENDVQTLLDSQGAI